VRAALRVERPGHSGDRDLPGGRSGRTARELRRQHPTHFEWGTSIDRLTGSDYVWGGTLLAISVPLRLAISGTAAWQAFARAITR